MQSKESQKFQLLYRLLDDSGLAWLSDEVRSFRFSGSYVEVGDEEVEIMRKLVEGGDQPELQLIEFSASQDTSNTVLKDYKDCIQYLAERVGGVAAYLGESMSLAKEIGIRSIQLGEEATDQESLIETAYQLKEVEKLIREMAAL